MKIGIYGLNDESSIMYKYFKNNNNLLCFSKENLKKNNNFKNLLECDIIFIFDMENFYELCDIFVKKDFNGIIVIKKTINSNINNFIEKLESNINYCNLKFIHNPSFLSNWNIEEDFINQKKVIIGCNNKENGEILKEFYKNYFNNFYKCSTNESEYIEKNLNIFYNFL